MNYFYPNGELRVEIPEPCVQMCSGSGDQYNNCLYWVEELKFEIPDELQDMAIKYLKSTGGFDDLDTYTKEEVAIRILWIACCEISEQGEWLGLIQ